MSEISPCLDCGACCAHFRVSFYWGELKSAGGLVPDELTEKLGLHRSCMIGTNQNSPRCVALQGTVGERVSCSIYEDRSSSCREFDAYLDDGSNNPRCDSARASYGLAPLRFVVNAEPANDDSGITEEVS